MVCRHLLHIYPTARLCLAKASVMPRKRLWSYATSTKVMKRLAASSSSGFSFPRQKKSLEKKKRGSFCGKDAFWPNGIIFDQPRFPWKKGISFTKPLFGVRSCKVARIWKMVWEKSYINPKSLQSGFITQWRIHGMIVHLPIHWLCKNHTNVGK